MDSIIGTTNIAYITAAYKCIKMPFMEIAIICVGYTEGDMVGMV